MARAAPASLATATASAVVPCPAFTSRAPEQARKKLSSHPGSCLQVPSGDRLRCRLKFRNNTIEGLQHHCQFPIFTQGRFAHGLFQASNQAVSKDWRHHPECPSSVLGSPSFSEGTAEVGTNGGDEKNQGLMARVARGLLARKVHEGDNLRQLVGGKAVILGETVRKSRHIRRQSALVGQSGAVIAKVRHVLLVDLMEELADWFNRVRPCQGAFLLPLPAKRKARGDEFFYKVEEHACLGRPGLFSDSSQEKPKAVCLNYPRRGKLASTHLNPRE